MNEDKPKFDCGSLEAALFAYGEPIGIKKLCDVFDISHEELASLASQLQQRLGERGSGLSVFNGDGRLALITLPGHGLFLEKLLKKEFSEELTPAAQETLAVVAYAGPVSRSEIEYIRGVNSSFTLRNLLIRGLIERETDPKRSGSYFYKLSFDCFKHLGLSRAEDLPDYGKYRELTDNFITKGTETDNNQGHFA